MADPIDIAGPYFEDFAIGQEFDAPAVTLTAGHAALNQAVTGDRLRLPLDHHASRAVTGADAPLAHPLLVTHVAIGQSTWASQRVKANLFYRGLVYLRPLHLGDTLYTQTRVAALRRNRSQSGRAATGMVALEVITHDQGGRQVLHFWRCPMIPCKDPRAEEGRQDDLALVGSEPLEPLLRLAVPGNWRTAAVTAAWAGRKAADLAVGMRFRIEARDTVTAAPEMVRLTLNMAMAHVDARLSYLDQRLVYGGHTIGIAFAQLARALPNLITLVGWESCDHTAPVMEGDRLRSEVTVLALEAVAEGALLKLLVRAFASRGAAQEEETLALEWVLWALSA